MSSSRTASARKQKEPKKSENLVLQEELLAYVRKLVDDPFKLHDLEKRTPDDEVLAGQVNSGVGICSPNFCTSTTQKRKPGEKCKCDYNPLCLSSLGFDLAEKKASSSNTTSLSSSSSSADPSRFKRRQISVDVSKVTSYLETIGISPVAGSTSPHFKSVHSPNATPSQVLQGLHSKSLSILGESSSSSDVSPPDSSFVSDVVHKKKSGERGSGRASAPSQQEKSKSSAASGSQHPPSLRVAVPPGITNLGATCYLNSLLQCLCQNTPFRLGLYKWSSMHVGPSSSSSSSSPSAAQLSQPSRFSEIISLLQGLFANLDMGSKSTLDCQDLARLLELNTGEQQDPQEFATLFLGKIEESFKKIEGDGPDAKGLRDLIPSVFRGNFLQVIECEAKHRSQREGHDDIRLNLDEGGGSDVQACLDRFFLFEELKGDNMYMCEQCEKKVNARKWIEPSSPPPVLSVSLMRYVYDMTTFTKKKLKTGILLSSSITLKVAGKSEEYILVAVLNHIGDSAYSGHYICEAMDWASGVWWRFNDETVTILENGPNHLVKTGAAASASPNPPPYHVAAASSAAAANNHVDLTDDDVIVDVTSKQPRVPAGKEMNGQRGGGGSNVSSPLFEVDSGSDSSDCEDDDVDSDYKESPGKQRSKGKAKSKAKPTASSAKKGRKPSLTNDELKATEGYAPSEQQKQPQKKQKTAAPSQKKGSEDAYMLMYVRKDYLAKHAAVGVAGLNDDLFNRVKKANAQFASECQRFVDSKEEKKFLVQRRKESVSEVFPLGAEEPFPGPGEDFRLVHSAWLRNWIAGAPLLQETVEVDSPEKKVLSSTGTSSLIKNRELFCEHDTLKVSPRVAHEFKILSMPVYDRLKTAVCNEVGYSENDFIDCEVERKDFQCKVCEHKYQADLRDKIRQISRWGALAEDLQNNGLSEHDGEVEKLCISQTWVTAFLKATKTKFTLAQSNPEGPLSIKFDDKFGDDEGEGFNDKVPDAKGGGDPEVTVVSNVNGGVASPFAELKSTSKGGKQALDPTVNSSILCPHAQFGIVRKQSYKCITSNAWKAVKELFPAALEVRTKDKPCELCTKEKSEDKETVQAAKNWAQGSLSIPELKGLYQPSRRNAAYPKFLDGHSEASSPESTLFLVGREAVETWRNLIDLAKAGSGGGDLNPQLFGPNYGPNSAKCPHDGLLLPERLRRALQGHSPEPLNQYGSNESPNSSSFELLTGKEVEQINYSLCDYASNLCSSSNGHRRGASGDGGVPPSLEMLAVAFRIVEHKVWEWRNISECSMCADERAKQIAEEKKTFRNKHVRIQIMPSNKVIGVGNADDEAEEEDMDDDAGVNDEPPKSAKDVVGGVLAAAVPVEPTRRSTRQITTRGGKNSEVTIDSDTNLGTFRLKLWETLSISPVGQHIYFKGAELTSDKNEDTLVSFGIEPGATLMVQNDKKGRSTAELEKFRCEEELTIASLFSLCGNPSTSERKAAGRKSGVVERGFGGSWLSESGRHRTEQKKLEVIEDVDEQVDSVDEIHVKDVAKRRKTEAGEDSMDLTEENLKSKGFQQHEVIDLLEDDGASSPGDAMNETSSSRSSPEY